VVGRTSSADFPVTSGAFQTTAPSTDFSGFVTELNSTGSALVYSTYLGGADADNVNGITLDSSNDAYLTGATASSDFPTTPGSFMPSVVNNATDAFVTELNSSGTALVYSTYLGGSSQDSGNAIALDSNITPTLSGQHLPLIFR
jgi:Beta-propeller repeat